MGIRELKQNASAVVKRAKEGEAITITERGVPVAKLLPIPEDKYLELVLWNGQQLCHRYTALSDGDCLTLLGSLHNRRRVLL